METKQATVSLRGQNRLKLCLLLWALAQVYVSAQSLPEGGVYQLDESKMASFGFQKDSLGFMRRIKDAEIQTWAVETTRQPDFIYNLSARIPLLRQPIEKGSSLLLSFEAKTEFAGLETGEARVQWVFGFSDNVKERVEKTISIASQWKQYHVRVAVPDKLSPDALFVAIQFGYPPQRWLMRNLKIVAFPASVPIETLPRTRVTYAGMEEDAPWRNAAKERIRQHRMGDFQVQFSYKNQPLENQQVQIQLSRHHFGWGAAFNAKDLGAEGAHLQRFTAAFNLGVFENDLKIKAWSLPERRAEVAAAIDVLSRRGVALKGHVLIWPGFRYLTPDFERFQKNPKLVSRMMKDHLESVLTATYGKISRWDVVNEAYTNTDLQRITGSEEILYQGFRMLKKREPGVLRYVNEYGIISRGGIDTKKQQWYYDFVRRIDAATGGLVDGIGMQSHIGSDLTPPEKVLQILDFYAPLGKKVSISEFTMDIDDPEIRTRYTRDFITAAFSHPSVYEFLFWGYKTEKSDIYDARWQHGTMGKAFFDLVHGEWKTKLLLPTDDKGMVSGRGFWGKYEYTVMLDGKLYKGEFDLLPGQGNVLKIKL